MAIRRQKVRKGEHCDQSEHWVRFSALSGVTPSLHRVGYLEMRPKPTDWLPGAVKGVEKGQTPNQKALRRETARVQHDPQATRLTLSHARLGKGQPTSQEAEDGSLKEGTPTEGTATEGTPTEGTTCGPGSCPPRAVSAWSQLGRACCSLRKHPPSSKRSRKGAARRPGRRADRLRLSAVSPTLSRRPGPCLEAAGAWAQGSLGLSHPIASTQLGCSVPPGQGTRLL